MHLQVYHLQRVCLSSCALLKLVHTLGNRKSCSATKKDQTATDIRGMKNHTEFSTTNKIDQLNRMRKRYNFADLHFICSLRRLPVSLVGEAGLTRFFVGEQGWGGPDRCLRFEELRATGIGALSSLAI